MLSLHWWLKVLVVALDLELAAEVHQNVQKQVHKPRKERPEIIRCLGVIKEMSQKAIPSNTTADISSQAKLCRISDPQQTTYCASGAYTRLAWYFSGTATHGMFCLKTACTIQLAQRHSSAWKKIKKTSESAFRKHFAIGDSAGSIEQQCNLNSDLSCLLPSSRINYSSGGLD